jgi:hypothetical protein
MKVQAMRRLAGTAVISAAALFGASMLASPVSAEATTIERAVEQTQTETVHSVELRKPSGSAADELYERKWWPYPGVPASGG